jgi:ACS family D-galactonate transporter-like MFS transporter
MSSYSPNPTAAAQPAVTARRSRRRIGILALLAIGTMINYLDRTVLGIAAPKLTAELGIDPAIMGIFSPPSPGPTPWRKSPAGCFLTALATK